jgi:DNA polymerase/3'-5' exonuclease PolX
LVWAYLDRLVATGILAAPTKAGDKMRCYPGSDTRPQLDVFAVTPPAEWGAIFAIRTGSAEFSQRCMVALRRRGLRCQDGAVWRGNVKLATPEEADFFRACGLPWVPPEERR